jgi:hypothetical protein
MEAVTPIECGEWHRRFHFNVRQIIVAIFFGNALASRPRMLEKLSAVRAYLTRENVQSSTTSVPCSMFIPQRNS